MLMCLYDTCTQELLDLIIDYWTSLHEYVSRAPTNFTCFRQSMLITQLVTQSVAMILFSSRTITFNYNNSDKLGRVQCQYKSP